jgi:DNA (cytosine-5)-methyltransferase 1
LEGPTFLEFFCGGGMARAGLGPDWRCLYANDLDPRKARAYAANYGAESLAVKDVADVAPDEIRERADLAWASFPCQDLSLAGNGAGLDGGRSGAFWPFWRLIEALGAEGRAPRLVVLENVCGLLASRGGADFAALLRAVSRAGYRAGALVIDAADFLAQSRPRLFLLAAAQDVQSPLPLRERARVRGGPILKSQGALPSPRPSPIKGEGGLAPVEWGVSPALLNAVARLPDAEREAHVWWRLPAPPRRNAGLADLIEDAPRDVDWLDEPSLTHLFSLMAPRHRERVAAAEAGGGREVGALNRRTRPLPGGGRTQRAEVRFDGLAGCLRTPAGGSSRQSILVVENGRSRARLLSAREAARLMGLPDTYALPASYNESYHLLGDGVAAPVVRHLARHWMQPLLGF